MTICCPSSGVTKSRHKREQIRPKTTLKTGNFNEISLKSLLVLTRILEFEILELFIYDNNKVIYEIENISFFSLLFKFTQIINKFKLFNQIIFNI